MKLKTLLHIPPAFFLAVTGASEVNNGIHNVGEMVYGDQPTHVKELTPDQLLPYPLNKACENYIKTLSKEEIIELLEKQEEIKTWARNTGRGVSAIYLLVLLNLVRLAGKRLREESIHRSSTSLPIPATSATSFISPLQAPGKKTWSAQAGEDIARATIEFLQSLNLR